MYKGNRLFYEKKYQSLFCFIGAGRLREAWIIPAILGTNKLIISLENTIHYQLKNLFAQLFAMMLYFENEQEKIICKPRCASRISEDIHTALTLARS